MKIVLGILAALLVLALIVGAQLVGTYNGLVTERNLVDQAFANVDTALTRRADLIPNLVETVKGFAKQEQGVIDSVTRARAALGGARTQEEKLAANSQLEGALSRLLVVVENYPQLKSNENFMALQNQLEGTENRIAQERRKYNETVTAYNTKIEVFPTNLVAGTMGFQRKQPMLAEPAQRQAPAVKF
jgi:LemA protein